ncbi:hypothetical protein MPC1_14470002 [Methylocella tundrae]|nr:hypothetical protein MPC1_14470002 [Methylocella tundrae]
MAFEPAVIGKIMTKITLEENDAGRLQILKQRAVALSKDRRWPQADEKMIAYRVDGLCAHFLFSPRISRAAV